MLLQRSEIVHLGAAGEVQRHLTGVAALPLETRRRAHAGVVPTEGDGGEQGVRVALTDGLMLTDQPRFGAQLVDAQVAHARRLRGAGVQHGHHQRTHTVGTDESLDDGDFTVLGGVDDEAREAHRAVDVGRVGDDDGLRHHGVARHRHHDDVHVREVEFTEEVVAANAVEQVGQRSVHRGGRGRHVGDARRVGDARDAGHGGDGAERREVQLGDAAVTPDLLVGGGEGQRSGPLESGVAHLGPGVRGTARRVGGQHGHAEIVLPR